MERTELIKELLAVTLSLKNKLKENAENKIEQNKLMSALMILRGNYLVEANNILDPEGKLVYKNAELREAFVSKRMDEEPSQRKLNDSVDRNIMLSAEIQGLEYQHKALIAVLREGDGVIINTRE